MPTGYPEIADLGGGVYRITHPLPWALNHVHCYAIADPSGWTMACGSSRAVADLVQGRRPELDLSGMEYRW